MNIVGIVAEYNPMHNGHIYNVQKAKELTHSDYAIVIMSGSFTEQGNIAVMDKFTRAKIAIENGADLVIELPTVYATSSSENFALGAVRILNSLGIVTHIAFGTEVNDISCLKDVSRKYLEHEQDITESIKEKMKSGISSAQAYDYSIDKYIGENTSLLFTPNNILAIQYITAICRLKSQIEPVLVQRLKSSHNDSKTPLNSLYASSTSIRCVLNDGTISPEEKLCKIKGYIPQNTYECLKKSSYNLEEDMWDILKYEILRLGKVGLKSIQGVEEGLENKLYNECVMSNSYLEYISNVKSKRYTLSRIKRICINILLGITKDKYDRLKNVEYARVLKVKNAKILSLISEKSTIPVITKITDESLNSLDNIVKESIELDIFSNNLINKNSPNMDYLNKINQP